MKIAGPIMIINLSKFVTATLGSNHTHRSADIPAHPIYTKKQQVNAPTHLVPAPLFCIGGYRSRLLLGLTNTKVCNSLCYWLGAVAIQRTLDVVGAIETLPTARTICCTVHACLGIDCFYFIPLLNANWKSVCASGCIWTRSSLHIERLLAGMFAILATVVILWAGDTQPPVNVSWVISVQAAKGM